MRFLEGVSAAAALEFRQRIRAGRWKWVLAGWLVLLLIITGLFNLAGAFDSGEGSLGGALFGVMALIVLILLLLVTPSLTGQSINGDRDRGTLATLQVTRLSALEIATGKLLAGWLTGIVFIALLIPSTIWCMALGGVSFASVICVYLVLTILIGVFCALSLAMSALFKRSTTSTVMSYLAIFVLLVITPIAFVSASSAIRTTRTIHSQTSGDYPDTESRPDLVWWIIAPNPVVVLSDASPHQPDSENGDLLQGLSHSVRSLREDPFPQDDDGTVDADGLPGDPSPSSSTGKPVWPYGLSFDLLLGIGALALATKRLRTPAKKLPRGQRVA
jgi:ABC-2 type transport system permease protein